VLVEEPTASYTSGRWALLPPRLRAHAVLLGDAVSLHCDVVVVLTSLAICVLAQVMSGRLLRIVAAHYKALCTLSVSSCGAFVASGGEDATVHLWRMAECVCGGGQSAESVMVHYPR
jgi:hypothetical protein